MRFLQRMISGLLVLCMVVSIIPPVSATEADAPAGRVLLDPSVTQTSVWIDGVEYAVQGIDDNRYVDLPAEAEPGSMVTYTYQVGDAGDIHTHYPLSMQVWALDKNEDGSFAARRIDALDNILQYSGSSIRITGNKGIRMITSIEKEKKNALTSGGLGGYQLLEYGTVLAWSDALADGSPLVLGPDYAKYNFAYKKGKADPVFAYTDNLMQYTNVLVGFSLEECSDDIAMRSYMILEDESGKQITIYGGIVHRSIGYIAWQNKGVFKPDTAAYNYVWEIIRHVYAEVTFQTNEGSEMESAFVYKGNSLEKPADPVKEGYSFAGWYTDEALSAAFDFSAPIAENMTLYAKWEAFDDGITDTDNDGMSDEMEEMLGLDPTKADTDTDGLLDAEEIGITGTDPLLPDSDENGVNDSDEDPDYDGLTNLEEIRQGTDPLKEDSDADTLTDSEELNIHGTDSNAYDTDGDTLSDGDEIMLGLNPLRASTDGKTPDAERTFAQTASDTCIDEALTRDNMVIPSVEGNVPDNINKHVFISEENVVALEDNRAAIGKAVSVDTDYAEGTDLQLVFSCPEDDARSDFYMICQYADGEFIPCETTQEGNSLRTTVTSGTYFVVDAEELLIELGIPIEKYKTSGYTEYTATETFAAPSGSASNEVPDEWYAENYVIVDENGDPVEEQAEADSAAADFENLAEGQELVFSSSLSMPTMMASGETSGKISGQADIVFVIDTTGSMHRAINNVVANIDSFVDTLESEYSVKANFALIDYRDITCGEETILAKNGSSAWFSDVASFKSRINSLYVEGGGDDPETPIDGLAMAHGLDFRQNANKFIILVTDMDYKNDNTYGVRDMDEMAAMLQESGIITSVISDTSYEWDYRNLYTSTGGVFGNIYGNFKSVLLQLAENIGEIVNDGSWVLLSDYQFIKLDQPLDDSGYSSDNDPLSDAAELGNLTERDVMPYINWVLRRYNIPEGMYDDPSTVKVYKYKSNPILPDTDYDGINDNYDNAPRDNVFKGELSTEQCDSDAVYTFDYRDFFASNTVYNKSLSTTSLLFSTFIYPDGGYSYDTPVASAHSSGLVSSIDVRSLMEVHGFEDIVIYDLAAKYRGGTNTDVITCGYTDDDITEVAIGHHKVTYNGTTKDIVAVIVRGTNGTIEEWSSNFEIGDLSKSDTIADWKNKNNHKGFDVASNRILSKLDEYVRNYTTDSVAYWVMGHSRGAAIANIISANLVDGGNEVFGYTFATPNTTVSNAATAAKYDCIFNLVNQDDFVPCVPMTGWNFKRYGQTASLDITSSMEKEWHKLTGISWYNQMSAKNLQELVDSLTAAASGWDSCYTYTCDCADHGNGTADDITERGINDINAIPARVRQYCKYKPYTNWLGSTEYEVCQLPAYFMQALADIITTGGMGDKAWKVVSTYQFADRYQKARNKIVSASVIGGIACPHYCSTYYLLTQYANDANFT